MIWIGINQRVDVYPDRNERRDALDQRWWDFLGACAMGGVGLANRPEAACQTVRALRLGGILLTGGGDLGDFGGETPERDATEQALIALARSEKLPIIGICRGAQALLHAFGATMIPVEGHIGVRHGVKFQGVGTDVNSYHGWGVKACPEPLSPLATDESGLIEAFRHRSEPLAGMMWHPEREAPFAERDIDFFKSFFGNRA